jgi:hypothetical protein
MVDGIQRIYDGGWDRSAESVGSKSEQVKQCTDLEHCLHLEPTHLVLTAPSTLATRGGAHSPEPC